MLTKSYLTFVILLTYLSVSAQESRKLILGKIVESTKGLSEVHIINLNSGEGTISDEDGLFSIHVKENDSILISSIQYVNQKIKIFATHIESNSVVIVLEPEVNILDEVFLHGLSGNLTLDLLEVPPDTIPKHNFVLRPGDLQKKLPPDTKGQLAAPNALFMTDPTYMGSGGIGASLPDKRYEAQKREKRNLAKKKVFPEKLVHSLGSDFFLVTLKIPHDRIYHFISYCEVRKIDQLYYENKLLQLIEILREESTTYLAAIHE